MTLSAARCCLAVPLLLALQGCPQSQPPVIVAPAAEADSDFERSRREQSTQLPGSQAAVVAHPVACTLVTPEEMSKILGAAVTAEGGDVSVAGECFYRAAKDKRPAVDMHVEWGAGVTAMSMGHMIAQIRPEVATAWQGIGDEATIVGSSLMIRNGADLMTLVIYNAASTEDEKAKAKLIFNTAKPRL